MEMTTRMMMNSNTPTAELLFEDEVPPRAAYRWVRAYSATNIPPIVDHVQPRERRKLVDFAR